MYYDFKLAHAIVDKECSLLGEAAKVYTEEKLKQMIKKACPFCKSNDLSIIPVFSEDDPKFQIAKAVQCNDCLCQGPINTRISWTECDKMAIEAWNGNE